MTYRATLDWMFDQLPMYQRQGKTAFKKDLTNIRAFSNILKNPESRFKSIHVAGTNGKGSVCHILASVFQEAGYKTGLYTSPHLKDYRERIRINGNKIPQAEVIAFINTHKQFLEKQGLSFFEMTVGMAFYFFAKNHVDIAIIETGMGGRLDSTNIISPELSIITNIGFDHTQFLGDTLSEIAYEKAGIIKPNTPVIIGEKNKQTEAVFLTKAQENKAPLDFASEKTYPPYVCDLKGSYQDQNIQTALCAIENLQNRAWKIEHKAIQKGLKKVKSNTGLSGRWQQLGSSPNIICDTGHNKEGLEFVMNQLTKESYERLHIILGVVNDKDLNRILPLFPKHAIYYFSRPAVPRGMDADILFHKAQEFDLKGCTFTTIQDAFQRAKDAAQPNDLIFIGGSTFTVAEVL